MRKLWLNVNVNQLANELGIPRQPDGVELRIDAPARAPIRREVRPGAQAIAMEPGMKAIQASVHTSFPEAEDAAANTMRMNPNVNVLIFEATVFLESVPTVPLRKKFNAVGELELLDNAA